MRTCTLASHATALLLAGVLAACTDPAVSDTNALDGDAKALFVTVDDKDVLDVQDLLGPDAFDGSREVLEAKSGRSIMPVREGELDLLAHFMHDRYHRCGGFMTFETREDARDAMTDEVVSATTGDRPMLVTEQETVRALIPQVRPASILSTINSLAAFPTRSSSTQSGVDAAHWLRDRWATMASGRPDATATLFTHTGWIQPSVMLTIPGEADTQEVIVIGGHLDSISFGGGDAPGADDDASGVATLTEVARILLDQDVRLHRTVIFMAYAAEEVGLRGSDQIARDFKARNVPVTSVMQLDMTNFKGSPAFDIVLFTDFTNPTQTNFLGELAHTYLPQLPVSRDACGYACSDHASWFRQGFPTVMPFESKMSDYNDTIHSSEDKIQVSGGNADQAAKFARLAIAYAVETAELADGGTVAATPVIAQVAYETPGQDVLGEFVDLHNPGETSFSLAGWSLSHGAVTWRFPATASIPAGGHLTIGRNLTGFRNLYGSSPDISGLSTPLTNGSGELLLRNAAGATADAVAWERTGWPLDAASGKSIMRTAGVDTHTAADWSVVDADPLGGQPL